MSIKIIRSILDTKNNRSIFGVTIAERIRRQKLGHLWNKRPAGVAVDTVVIHYISAAETYPRAPFSLQAILKIFCDRRVSAHYLIDRSGIIYRLVPEKSRAWHAGGSSMPAPDNRRNVNDFSIGIELVGTSRHCFTESQYEALAALSHDIQTRQSRFMTFVGHQDIAGKRAVALGLRPDQKADPGALFDWKRLRRLVAVQSSSTYGGI